MKFQIQPRYSHAGVLFEANTFHRGLLTQPGLKRDVAQLEVTGVDANVLTRGQDLEVGRHVASIQTIGNVEGNLKQSHCCSLRSPFCMFAHLYIVVGWDDCERKTVHGGQGLERRRTGGGRGGECRREGDSVILLCRRHPTSLR